MWVKVYKWFAFIKPWYIYFWKKFTSGVYLLKNMVFFNEIIEYNIMNEELVHNVKKIEFEL